MDVEVISAIRQELAQAADDKIRESSTHYFKEDIQVYGIQTAAVTRIARKYFSEIKMRPKAEIFALCEELFKSNYMEEAFIACEWSYRIHSQYAESDFAVFERWVKTYVNNWAKCDTLCNHTIGSLVDKFPHFIEDLKGWTRSDNRWVKRASAVTLIVPACLLHN